VVPPGITQIGPSTPLRARGGRALSGRSSCRERELAFVEVQGRPGVLRIRQYLLKRRQPPAWENHVARSVSAPTPARSGYFPAKISEGGSCQGLRDLTRSSGTAVFEFVGAIVNGDRRRRHSLSLPAAAHRLGMTSPARVADLRRLQPGARHGRSRWPSSFRSTNSPGSFWPAKWRPASRVLQGRSRRSSEQHNDSMLTPASTALPWPDTFSRTG